MFRRLSAWFVHHHGANAESSDAGANDDGDEGDESGFLPSRLDASVLVADGHPDREAEREIASVQKQGEILEAHR